MIVSFRGIEKAEPGCFSIQITNSTNLPRGNISMIQNGYRALYLFKSITAFAVAMAVAGTASAEWRSGYGQGNLEYFSDKQDLRLYIACPTKETGTDRTAAVSLTRISTGHGIQKFTVTVNGHTYDGPMESDSRVGSGNFLLFMEDIRKSDVVLRYALGTVVFSKANAAKVVPPPGRSFPCNTGF